MTVTFVSPIQPTRQTFPYVHSPPTRSALARRPSPQMAGRMNQNSTPRPISPAESDEVHRRDAIKLNTSSAYVTGDAPRYFHTALVKRAEGLGLQLIEIKSDGMDAVIIASQKDEIVNSWKMSKAERRERQKIQGTLEIVAVNGMLLEPRTMEYCHHLVHGCTKIVDLTLRRLNEVEMEACLPVLKGLKKSEEKQTIVEKTHLPEGGKRTLLKFDYKLRRFVHVPFSEPPPKRKRRRKKKRGKGTGTEDAHEEEYAVLDESEENAIQGEWTGMEPNKIVNVLKSWDEEQMTKPHTAREIAHQGYLDVEISAKMMETDSIEKHEAAHMKTGGENDTEVTEVRPQSAQTPINPGAMKKDLIRTLATLKEHQAVARNALVHVTSKEKTLQKRLNMDQASYSLLMQRNDVDIVELAQSSVVLPDLSDDERDQVWNACADAIIEGRGYCSIKHDLLHTLAGIKEELVLIREGLQMLASEEKFAPTVHQILGVSDTGKQAQPPGDDDPVHQDRQNTLQTKLLLGSKVLKHAFACKGGKRGAKCKRPQCVSMKNYLVHVKMCNKLLAGRRCDICRHMVLLFKHHRATQSQHTSASTKPINTHKMETIVEEDSATRTMETALPFTPISEKMDNNDLTTRKERDSSAEYPRQLHDTPGQEKATKVTPCASATQRVDTYDNEAAKEKDRKILAVYRVNALEDATLASSNPEIVSRKTEVISYFGKVQGEMAAREASIELKKKQVAELKLKVQKEKLRIEKERIADEEAELVEKEEKKKELVKEKQRRQQFEKFKQDQALKNVAAAKSAIQPVQSEPTARNDLRLDSGQDLSIVALKKKEEDGSEQNFSIANRFAVVDMAEEKVETDAVVDPETFLRTFGEVSSTAEKTQANAMLEEFQSVEAASTAIVEAETKSGPASEDMPSFLRKQKTIRTVRFEESLSIMGIDDRLGIDEPSARKHLDNAVDVASEDETGVREDIESLFAQDNDMHPAPPDSPTIENHEFEGLMAQLDEEHEEESYFGDEHHDQAMEKIHEMLVGLRNDDKESSEGVEEDEEHNQAMEHLQSMLAEMEQESLDSEDEEDQSEFSDGTDEDDSSKDASSSSTQTSDDRRVER